MEPIEAARRAAALSIGELSARAGISYTTLQRMEAGFPSLPPTQHRLMTALGIDHARCGEIFGPRETPKSVTQPKEKRRLDLTRPRPIKGKADKKDPQCIDLFIEALDMEAAIRVVELAHSSPPFGYRWEWAGLRRVTKSGARRRVTIKFRLLGKHAAISPTKLASSKTAEALYALAARL